MSKLEVTQEAGVRFLQFDNHWIQGAMRVSHPWALELGYTRVMMFGLLLRARASWPQAVLQIGLGAGSITRFFYRYLPDARLVVVELDPRVVMTAWDCFLLPAESRRLKIELEDGYRYMAATNSRFDWIMVDGFKADARTGRLNSPTFFRRCRERLADGGLLVVNLLGRPVEVKKSIERIGRAFSRRVLVLPRYEDNTIVLAATGAEVDINFEVLRRRAQRLRVATGLNLMPTVARFAKAAGRGGGGITL
ncbi:MAG: fused MFS/spermidine synthase [Burkholderiales bacterium]